MERNEKLHLKNNNLSQKKELKNLIKEVYNNLSKVMINHYIDCICNIIPIIYSNNDNFAD